MTSASVEAVNKFLFCWQFAKNVIIFDELFQIIGVFGFFWQNLSKNCQKGNIWLSESEADIL